MPERDVLAEIRAVRDELSQRYGGAAWALARAMADRSKAAGRHRAFLTAVSIAAPRRCDTSSGLIRIEGKRWHR